jgi:uncharacterized Zn finger protein
MEKLRKKGLCIQPVKIEGRQIAQSFWGQAWCDHLEKFSDYENRLPRGRSYIRNGSVCHLEIAEGSVKAMVSGSQLYNVNIEIKKLPGKKWAQVKKRCAGQIRSLLELLQGRLSKSVMAVVTDRDNGLFPHPGEISLHCTCPDWAVMCKHVAAVMYGVGARLDEKPDLLFLLRGVEHEELISAEAGIAAVSNASETDGHPRIAESDLSNLFGIEMTEGEAAVFNTPAAKRPVSVRKERQHPPKAPTPKAKSKPLGKRKKLPKAMPVAPKTGAVTGKAVAKLRTKFNMSQAQFAQVLGVSPATIGNWEKREGTLNLRASTQKTWEALLKLKKTEARLGSAESHRVGSRRTGLAA